MQCTFGIDESCQLILLFSLFLLLLMGSTALFDTIYRSYYIILANFYFYLQYFQQKNFNFSKISRFQTHPQCVFGMMKFASIFYYSSYFCYYSWATLTFWYYLWVSLYYFNYFLPLSIVFSVKKILNFSKISGFQTDHK